MIACKTINYKEDHKKAKKHAENEYEILSQLHHPNITQFIDAEWKPNQLRLYMEFYPDGTLDDLIVEKRRFDCRLLFAVCQMCLNSGCAASTYASRKVTCGQSSGS